MFLFVNVYIYYLFLQFDANLVFSSSFS
jgi:uncharacterized membrane protein YgcG